MSTPGSRVPFPLRLAVRLLPKEVREEVLGDLIEHWNLRVSEQHWLARLAWTWRQPLSTLAARLRFRRRSDQRQGIAGGRNRGVGVSWLDFKLGFRMLARYPGLTVVAGLAMAFAIFVGAATFEFINQMVNPTLPLPDGERIVGLRYWNRAENDEELPLPYDLRIWREKLSTVEHLGGFLTVVQNLAVGEEAGEQVQVARISPVGFRVANTPPLLGRSLVQGDAEPGVSPVVVLGYRVWQTHFGGNSAVVGRTVRLGNVRRTVVGVMPESFGFPRDHNLWTPLRLEEFSSDVEPRALRVFGRLASGATLAAAQAEMNAIAAASAREAPERHEYLTAEVLPYWESLFGTRMGLVLRAMLYHLNVYPALFLILVGGNIALLMFARAATRAKEIAVRNALGASQGRIVTQLFVEALVLGTLATVLGLAATGPLFRWVLDELRGVDGGLPFWFHDGLSPTTVVYAALLTLLGAVVAGVVPALKVTGRGMQARLQQTAAGAGGLRLGGIWTGVIVTQIAVTVVFTGAAYPVARQAVRNASVQPYFPAEQYLGVRIEMDRENSVQGTREAEEEFIRRYASALRELERQITEDPTVSGVTLANQVPGKGGGVAWVDVEGGRAAPLDRGQPGHAARSDVVDLNFFDVFRTPVVAGRGLDSRDVGEGVNTVVVNASFAEDVLGGRSAIGRRMRYLGRDRSGEPGPWYEIVGVVRDLVADQTMVMSVFEAPPKARIYHPLDPSRVGSYPLQMVVHVPGGPGKLVPTLYAIADAVSPGLSLHEIETLDRTNSDIELSWRLFAYLAVLVGGIALFLSLAGVYAVMSFTVARRTREIGVRVALGAKSPRVIAEIFRKPVAQIGTGVAVGSVLLGMLAGQLRPGGVTTTDGAVLLALGVGILGVCALACIGPTRQALRVGPAEALRAEE